MTIMAARKRPVNLNLLTMRFPIPAIASILHRISGVLLFLFLPALLWVLQQSLASSASFDGIKYYFNGAIAKFFIWLFFSSLIYHLLAGFRHLMMDADVGESLAVGRLTARLVIVLATIASICIGVWLW
jgi:succinate dehydrogenase / fumarate reductase cytochrome b subunit